MIIWPSHINCGRDGSEVAHHHMTGEKIPKNQTNCHIGLQYVLYAIAPSTYVGIINLHWALLDMLLMDTIQHLMSCTNAMKAT